MVWVKIITLLRLGYLGHRSYCLSICRPLISLFRIYLMKFKCFNFQKNLLILYIAASPLFTLSLTEWGIKPQQVSWPYLDLVQAAVHSFSVWGYAKLVSRQKCARLLDSDVDKWQITFATVSPQLTLKFIFSHLLDVCYSTSTVYKPVEWYFPWVTMLSRHCFLPFKETFSIADKQFKTGNKLSSAKVQCVTNPFSD